MTDSTFTVSIPKVDWDGRAADMRSRLATWEWRWQLPAGRTQLLLDFSPVRFMEPWALALFTAYGLEMRRRGLQVRVRIDAQNPANAYLRDMGLLEALESGAAPIATTHWQRNAQNTGLHVIQDYSGVQRFKRSADVLALEHCPEARDALAYAMAELGRNVVQHAQSSIGGVAIAQFFPDRQGLQVAICDLGCGVRKALEWRYPELKNDTEALRMALLPHSSGGASPTGPYASGPENAGLGLFYCRQIASRAGGSFWIASGRALVGVRRDVPSPDDRPAEAQRVYRRIESWPGTIVALDFPVEGVADFSGILAECGQLADEARRQSGPSGIEFVEGASELGEQETLRIADFVEDNDVAKRNRDEFLLPRVREGRPTVLDFSGVRVPTQSFVHALLRDVFKVPGSLVRLSFLNCTPSAREVIKTVAAYATYKQIPL